MSPSRSQGCVRFAPLLLLPLAACTGLLAPEVGSSAIDPDPGWTCPRDRWADGTCDCGCGTEDTEDCATPEIASCERHACWTLGDRGVPLATDPTRCALAVCGDGWYEPFAHELCDDGNNAAGDGCSPDCRTQSVGWRCGRGADGCRPVVCGDGLVDTSISVDDPGEPCDDGNAIAGDGCAADCTVEAGWYCPPPSDGVPLNERRAPPCREAVCGNGDLEYGAETCDDGNTADGDGCSATCVIDDDWRCTRPGRPCVQRICGDGHVDEGGTAPEECDDGNDDGTDACSNTCQRQACPAVGEPCVAVPAAWRAGSCDLHRYGDGQCDCGCGVDDVDCGANYESSDCGHSVCREGVDPADPTACLPEVNTCRDAYMCVADCHAEAACEAACRAGLDATSEARDAALWTCAADACPPAAGVDYFELRDCHDELCSDEFHDCIFDGNRLDDALSCQSALFCVLDCGDRADGCFEDCTSTLEATSNAALQRVLECAEDKCTADPHDSREHFECITDRCGARYHTCDEDD